MLTATAKAVRIARGAADLTRGGTLTLIQANGIRAQAVRALDRRSSAIAVCVTREVFGDEALAGTRGGHVAKQPRSARGRPVTIASADSIARSRPRADALIEAGSTTLDGVWAGHALAGAVAVIAFEAIVVVVARSALAALPAEARRTL